MDEFGTLPISVSPFGREKNWWGKGGVGVVRDASLIG